MSSIFKQLVLKRKYKSKKCANLLHDTFKCQVLQNDSHFLGAIYSKSKGLVSLKQVQLYVLLLRRAVGRGRIGWPRVRIIFNLDYHKTKKPSGHRMGHGKGKGVIWSRVVVPGLCFLKIMTYPQQYVFFDHLSWTCIFAYFEHNFINHYAIGLSRMKFSDLDYLGLLPSPFRLVDFVDYIPRLAVFYDYKENANYFPLIASLFDFIFEFGAGVSRLCHNVFFVKKQFNSKIYLKIFVACLLSTSIFSSRNRIPSSKLSVFFLTRGRSSRLLSFSILNSWFLGYFFSLLLKSYRSDKMKYVLRFISKFTKYRNLIRLTGNRLLNYAIRKYVLLATEYEHLPYPSRAVLEQAIDTLYPAEYLPRYPLLRSTKIQSIYRALRRIKYKLPFKSEIILPRSCKYSYYLHKRKSTFEHRNQCARP